MSVSGWPDAREVATSRAGVLARARAVLLIARSREGAHEKMLLLSWALVIAGVLGFILIVGQHAVVRYQGFNADAFDLGNMDQAVWNTLHGHPFRFTNRGLDWFGPPTRLGIHVEPVLLLIAPLYLIHSGPETLLILQTVMLALGAIPLFLLSLRKLPEQPLIGATLALAYLLTPELLGEALWDFHAVALATPLLLLAVWAMDARRYGWFLVAVILAMGTKESVGLAVAPLGLYIAIWQRRPRLGYAVAVLAALWVAISFRVILPHFNGGISSGNNYWYRYSWLGTSPGSAIVNVLLHPWLPVWFVLSDAARRGYLAHLFRINGALGIFAPALWVCALPELAINLLSTHPEQYSGFFQYNATIIAFVSASAVYGVARLYHARYGPAVASAPATPSGARATGWASVPTRLRATGARIGRWWDALIARIPLPERWYTVLVGAWLVAMVALNFATASPRLATFWSAGVTPGPHAAATDALLARVPADVPVATTDDLNAHLSDRYTIYLMPDPQSYQAEYVAANVARARPLARAADAAMLARMQASGRYVTVGTSGGVILLKRVGPPLAPDGTPFSPENG